MYLKNRGERWTINFQSAINRKKLSLGLMMALTNNHHWLVYNVKSVVFCSQ